MTKEELSTAVQACCHAIKIAVTQSTPTLTTRQFNKGVLTPAQSLLGDMAQVMSIALCSFNLHYKLTH